MNKQIIFFVIVTIIFLVLEAICIKTLKKHEIWYDLKSSLIVSVKDKLPLIIGVATGIIVSVMLNVDL